MSDKIKHAKDEAKKAAALRTDDAEKAAHQAEGYLERQAAKIRDRIAARKNQGSV